MTVDRAALKALCEITVHCEPEDQDPEGCFASGDDELDRRQVQAIRDAMQHNVWAWCWIRVSATYAGETESDSMGGCSYASERAFRTEEGGYYADMVEEAVEALAERLEKVDAALKMTEAELALVRAK